MDTSQLQEWFTEIGLSELPAFLQIVAVMLSSFISEDATLAITSLLYKASIIAPEVYWAGGVLGIIIGDELLYIIGKQLVKKRTHILKIPLKKFECKVDNCKRHRFIMLVMARFIPGTRLPAYISAGATKYPPSLFLLANLISVPIWVYLYSLFGSLLIHVLNKNIWAAICLAALFYLAYRSVRQIFRGYKNIPISYAMRSYLYGLIRYFYYEFWPAKIFYTPQFIFVIMQAIRYKGKVWLPALANPSIKNGGLVGESKTECYSLLPIEHSSLLRSASLPLHSDIKKISLINQFIKDSNIEYPIILKPEKGQRGGGVRLIHNEIEAVSYTDGANFGIMAQEFCNYNNEAGIFYVSYPDDRPSEIFSITHKEFPVVIGDGKQTIGELILSDKRARLISSVYLYRLSERIEEIPSRGEIIKLVSCGNHAQGAIFSDGMERLYTTELHATLDKLVDEMDGFYIGRFDIRYQDEISFRKGQNFKIIEVNGAGAEATHIYDSKLNIFQAYRVLYKQVSLIFEIGSLNCNSKTGNISTKQILYDWYNFSKVAKNYSIAS